jgi:solute carrier family 45 protein 1/2/4
MALVFVAGPLSGLLVQPLIGTHIVLNHSWKACTHTYTNYSSGSLADSSKSKYGRRRPYMLIGTGLCVLAMLLLGYTRGFASLFSTAHSSFVRLIILLHATIHIHDGCFRQNDNLTIWLAVLAIYAMDFAVNAGSSAHFPCYLYILMKSIVMAVDRALVVDSLPAVDQAQGNAWLAIMSGIGGVLGFFLCVPFTSH